MIQVHKATDSGTELTIELLSNLSMSLDRFFAVFLVLSAVMLVVALYPLILGLWPVMVIALVHVGLVGWCFRRAWRGNWARQVIHFGPETVTIVHLTADKRWQLEWPVNWLRLAQDLDQQGQPRVYLQRQGLRQEIGEFLPTHERHELRGLIGQALAQRTAWMS
ncbi:MAG TPA: DUF2244 domain-containing protein [Wenzhouxiangella sp.]